MKARVRTVQEYEAFVNEMVKVAAELEAVPFGAKWSTPQLDALEDLRYKALKIVAEVEAVMDEVEGR